MNVCIRGELDVSQSYGGSPWETSWIQVTKGWSPIAAPIGMRLSLATQQPENEAEKQQSGEKGHFLAFHQPNMMLKWNTYLYYRQSASLNADTRLLENWKKYGEINQLSGRPWKSLLGTVIYKEWWPENRHCPWKQDIFAQMLCVCVCVCVGL